MERLSDSDRVMAVGMAEFEQLEAAMDGIPPELLALLRYVFFQGFGKGIECGAKFAAAEACKIIREAQS